MSLLGPQWKKELWKLLQKFIILHQILTLVLSSYLTLDRYLSTQNLLPQPQNGECGQVF